MFTVICIGTFDGMSVEIQDEWSFRLLCGGSLKEVDLNFGRRRLALFECDS